MNNVVESKRIQYTASRFAKKSLLYLQESGFSRSITKHTSYRNYLDSFLFFTVIEGNGILRYQNEDYKLKEGDCVFINCRNEYSHTSDNWKIAWVHFNGNNLKNIFNKYLERGGKITFSSPGSNYLNIINKIYNIADSSAYLKDMNIYNELVNLLNLLMSETIYEDSSKNRKYNLDTIKRIFGLIAEKRLGAALSLFQNLLVDRIFVHLGDRYEKSRLYDPSFTTMFREAQS